MTIHDCGDTEMEQGVSWRRYLTYKNIQLLTCKKRLEATHGMLKDLEELMADQCENATPDNLGVRMWLQELRIVIARMEGRE